MSCIDAAIIKALVEHIGMNPEDVPVGSPHECIKYTAGEGIAISGDNVISATTNAGTDEKLNVTFSTGELDGTNVIKVEAPDYIYDFILPGDVLIVENINNKKKQYYFIRSANSTLSKFNVFDTNGSAYEFELPTAKSMLTNIDTSYYTPIGVFRPRTAETLSMAVMILMRFTYSMHKN